VADSQPQFFQFFGHPRSAVAAQGLLELIPDVGQHDQVLALAGTDGTVSPGPIAARANVHDLAQAFHRNIASVFFDEGKPHLLLSAKNTFDHCPRTMYGRLPRGKGVVRVRHLVGRGHVYGV